MKNLIATVLLLVSSISQAALLDQAIITPEIHAVMLKQFSAETNSATFEVEVYNPNTFKLPIRELAGDILLANNKVAALSANSPKSLAAQSSQVFTVPIKVNVDNLMLALNQILISGDASYRFSGYMMTPIGELPIEQQGALSNEQIMALFQTLLNHS